MAKHIGIIAVSSEGAAICYREIQRALKKRTGVRGLPSVTLHNAPFDVYVEAARREDWHAVGALLLDSAKRLANAGAEFCVVPDNVMQYAIPLCENDAPIPFLNMAQIVADAVEADGRSTVGVIGTAMVMSGTMYQVPLGLKGIQLLRPEGESATDVDRIIFDELVFGRVQIASQRRLIGVIDELAQAGCDGVILGCSEAPLVVTEQNAPIPIYDAGQLLAEAAATTSTGQSAAS